MQGEVAERSEVGGVEQPAPKDPSGTRGTTPQALRASSPYAGELIRKEILEMAHKRDYKPEDIAFPNQVITESELVSEMQTSYIDYAMSVIVGRALPDVRDGLEPVHRRLLSGLFEGGLTRGKP